MLGVQKFWGKVLSLDQLPRPIYIAQEGEKIDFARGVSLESETEAERHSESSGDG